MLGMRKYLVGALLLVALVLAVRYWNAGSEKRQWSALTIRREKAVWNRYLPALDRFLERHTELSSDRGYGPHILSGYKDNRINLDGSWIVDRRIGVSCRPEFYFEGWEVEPKGAEFALRIEPWVVEKIAGPEVKALVNRTRAEGALHAGLAGTRWFSRFDDKGVLHTIVRVNYPSPWVENIPEYDRGFSDEMHFEVSRRARRFLYRQAFADPYTPLDMSLPVFNPPSHVGKHALGTATGYIVTKSGRILTLEIFTSLSEPGSREGTLHVTISPYDRLGWEVEEAKKLFKPEFFQRLGQSFQGGLQLEAASSEDDFQFRMFCPLDFPLQDASLDTLTVVPPG